MGALPLARHSWHGDWNYTLRPQPSTAPAATAPPARAAPPRRAGAGQAALTHPALTGLSRQDLDHLVTALALPWSAQQEALRYQRRGGPRRNAPGAKGRTALGLPGQLAVTLIHQHLSVPQHVLAWLTGTHPATISQALKTIRPLLSQHQAQPAPAPARLRTPSDVISYATAAGITFPPELKPAC